MTKPVSTAQILVITVIPGVELDSVLAVFKDKYRGGAIINNTGDNAHTIELTNSHGLPLRIAACATEQSGNLSSALETTRNLLRFYPRLAFLCGIAGNMRPDRCELGDVIIPAKIEYRRYNRVSKGERLESTSDTRPIEDAVRKRFTDFITTHPLDLSLNNPYAFAAATALAGRGRPRPPLIEHKGDCKALCWDMVLDCETTRSRLCNGDNMLRAVEMESEGFFSSLQLVSEKVGYKISGMVFRGLSDLASGKLASDNEITVKWRNYAAWNASRVMVEFINDLREDDFKPETPSAHSPAAAYSAS